MKLATAYLGFKLRTPLIPSASPLSEKLDHIRVLEHEMREWMEDHEYESVEQIKGIMSQKSCPDPTAFERAQYTRAEELSEESALDRVGRNGRND